MNATVSAQQDEVCGDIGAQQLVDRIARSVVDRGLEVPVALFLEMNKPISFLLGQSALLASPLLAPFVGIENLDRVSTALSDRTNVDILIDRIEELSKKARAVQ